MLTTPLYGYQDQAVDMLIENDGGLVAYEMGLGKTIVAIAYCEEMFAEDPPVNHALIVVPSTLRYQWAQAIAQFTDVPTVEKKMRDQTLVIPDPRYCVVIDGPPLVRGAQYDYIRDKGPDYIIVSYDIVNIDFKEIKRFHSDLVVLDECTAIKSFKAQRSKKIKRLDCDLRVGLTGTPVENRPEELYSIMEFIDPGFLGRFDLFDKSYIVRNHFGAVLRYKNLDVLYRKMRRVMSRKTRLDPDVAKHMPEVSTSDKYVTLTTKQRRLYKKIAGLLDADLAELQGTDFNVWAHYNGDEDENSTRGRVMAKVTALRQLCDDPELLRISAERGSSQFAMQLAEAGLLEGLGEADKHSTVVEDVMDIIESHPENKVIVFSQFRTMIDLLSTSLDTLAPHAVYTGAMSNTQKEAEKARFKTDPDCRIILCSDAGGYGLDLPEANYLLNMDLPDSAGKFAQRNARHVRAGSKHSNVFIVNYITEDTVEERGMDRLRFKQSVADAILDGVSDGGEVENDVESLSNHVKETVGG